MRHARAARRLQTLWYGGSRWYLALLPLAWLFCAVVTCRRLAFRFGLLAAHRLDARVVVVGNISTGGTGKTPLVIAIAARLQEAGYRVGIITRGYGGRARRWPQAVQADSDAQQVGDEAVLLARRTGVPIYAGPDRVAAGRALLKSWPCDVIVSDDGLQHYALCRDLEIVLVDAERGFGNGYCLPAGPLREPRGRLVAFDAVAAIGSTPVADWILELRAERLHRVGKPADSASLQSFVGRKVYAVAGVGNPQRFFRLLRDAGLEVEARAFPDHHCFTAGDLAPGDDRAILMTEKDAVKCTGFAPANCWYLPVTLVLPAAFDDWLLKRLG